jgi:signal transduction histidine kinase
VIRHHRANLTGEKTLQATGIAVAFMRHFATRVALAPLPLICSSQQALAQSFGANFTEPGVALASIAAIGVFGWAFFSIRRFGQQERANRQRIANLEVMLNDAEAALAADAQILVSWRGAGEEPQRFLDSMHGQVAMPRTAEDIIHFAEWLESDSAGLLGEALSRLRQSGKAFNMGVRTAGGDLIEADGRAAGGLATLRFRPISGERQQITELAYDAHKLGKQVERLSAVLDQAPLPIWIRNPDGALSWVNQAYVKATDMATSDAVIKSRFALANDDRLDKQKADVASGLIGRAQTVLSGKMRALNIFERPVNFGTAGFAIDITPEVEAEKELERHIKAHASTLNKLDTAIAIFGPDQKLRFHNQAYVALWGFDENWLESKPSDGEILDRLRAQRCLPEQANYREWRLRQLSSYTTLEMRENYWYLPDGRSLHVVCEQHPFGGVTYLYENLTKEIQLESRYNVLIGVQRETLDNLAEAIALIGSDGRLKLFNPAFVKFWSFEPLMLSAEPHVEELAKHKHLSDQAQGCWQDIKYGMTSLDTDRKAMAGRITQDERILQYSAVPLPDGNTLLSFSDITDPAKMERALRERTEALEAADRIKNDFLSSVSYEVRTPLTSILGFAETLDLGLLGPMQPKQHEYVVDIRKSSEDLKTIIDAIIDLSAVDAGAMELRLAPVDLEETMQRVAENLSPRWLKREITLTIEVADDIQTIIADQVRVEQILSHVLANAIGFSASGSTVRMGVRKLGTMAQIWVADTGRGIEPAFQVEAFERFKSKPLPGGHRGPGLGLALVKSFTELHAGKVSLISKPGQGTTVICALPIAGPPIAKSGDSPKTTNKRLAS